MPCPRGTVAFRFNVTNPEAVAWIKAHAAELVVQVTAETRTAIRAVIQRSFEEGIAPRDAAKLIRSLVGLTERDALAVVHARERWLAEGVKPDVVERRAEKYAGKLHRRRALTIARHETMTASNRGQLELWRQAIDAGSLRRTMHKTWIIAEDERTCDLCLPLDGIHTPVLEPFAETGTMGPPRHVQCLPGDSLVLPGARITAVSKRWFDGDLLIIRVTGDRELACTPNHPILTPLGWLPASRLDVGGHVVCDARSQWRGRGNGDHQDIPARIEDVAHALFGSGEVVPVPVPIAAEDFHGDGIAGEVAVVWADRFAGHDAEATFDQPDLKLVLVSAHSAPVAFSSDRTAAERFECPRGATDGSMSGRNLPSSLPGCHVRPFHSFGLGLRPQLDATLAQPALDDIAADAELARQLINGAAGPVEVADVVSIKRQSWRGHVFNLETADGWFAAQGIITHNCRCTYGLIDDPTPRAYVYERDALGRLVGVRDLAAGVDMEIEHDEAGRVARVVARQGA